MTTVVWVPYPDSLQIMDHPEARAVFDKNNLFSYIVPVDVWEKYKTGWYIATPTNMLKLTLKKHTIIIR